MDEEPAAEAVNLCAAIDAALRLADAADNTLVSALLAEAYNAAFCSDGAT